MSSKKKFLTTGVYIFIAVYVIGMVSVLTEGSIGGAFRKLKSLAFPSSREVVVEDNIQIGNLSLANPIGYDIGKVSVVLTRTDKLSWWPEGLPNEFFIGIPVFYNDSIYYFETSYESGKYLDILRFICENAQKLSDLARNNGIQSMDRIIPVSEHIWAFGESGYSEPLTVLPVFRVVKGDCYLVLLFQTTYERDFRKDSGAELIIPTSEIARFLQIISDDNVIPASNKLEG